MYFAVKTQGEDGKSEPCNHYQYTIIRSYHYISFCVYIYIYIYHTIISFLVAKSSSKKFEFKSNSSGPWILGFPAQHFPQRQCVLKMFRIYFDVRLSIYIYIHIYTYIHIYIHIYISLSRFLGYSLAFSKNTQKLPIRGMIPNKYTFVVALDRRL